MDRGDRPLRRRLALAGGQLIPPTSADSASLRPSSACCPRPCISARSATRKSPGPRPADALLTPTLPLAGRWSAALGAAYHRVDDRAKAAQRGRGRGLSVRRVRGRSRIAFGESRSSSSLLCGTATGAARRGAPGGVLPVRRIRGLPHVPGLGQARGRSCSRRGGAAHAAAFCHDDSGSRVDVGRPPRRS